MLVFLIIENIGKYMFNSYMIKIKCQNIVICTTAIVQFLL